LINAVEASFCRQNIRYWPAIERFPAAQASAADLSGKPVADNRFFPSGTVSE
jgi:hypothetical protein